MRDTTLVKTRALFLSFAALTTGCEPLADEFNFEREEVPIFERSELVPPPVSAPSNLRVMAYNIKFGAARTDFWFDYWGDQVQLDYSVVAENLGNIYALVREADPDILIVEEIEVGSRRSAYYDMVAGMLEGTNLNYAAYIQTWQSRYVASEGLGRVDMGNAIFSKYPITFAERIRQPDRTDISGLILTFYLHRMIGHAVVDIGNGRTVGVYGVHTEAYDRDGTKGRQIEQIYTEVMADTMPFVLGGDFNELPPTAVKIDNFPDEHPITQGTPYEQPPYTPEIMLPFYNDLTPWISLDEYGTTDEEQSKYYTHSVIGPLTEGTNGQPGFWNRTLDYLFIPKNNAFEPGKSDVLQSPGRQGIKSDPLLLSDHAPVIGTWIVGGAP
ncbi:MAG: endonuclease/exonuclease/phosphatase family protein [Polyangiaceae bacterium]|nr:endonuclease/exonuclease/phosphatase family protein [Polyangiaceae bacterium]